MRVLVASSGIFHKLNAARGELAKFAARRQAVELLRDQQLEEFKREQNMRESQELDEMSVMRFKRDDGIRL